MSASKPSGKLSLCQDKQNQRSLMKKNTISTRNGQGLERQSAVLKELCYRFVYPLLKRLHGVVDWRLVQTRLGLITVIVIHRYRN
jgi:hypothetical protein